MRKHWTLIGIGVLLAAFAVASIACSSSKKNTSATQTAQYQAPAATQTAVETSQPTAGTPLATEGTPSGGSPTVKQGDSSTLGRILVDSEGRTLYKFANDQPNVSNCNGACAALWPPLTISSGTPGADTGVAGQLGTITRSDGTMQVTLDGVPLYRFANDTAPGDAKGDGFANGLWSVAVKY